MNSKDRFVDLCIRGMRNKGVCDAKYQERFKRELREVDNLDEYDYFLDLCDAGTKYLENENNLLICYVLGLVEKFDINKESPVILIQIQKSMI